MQAGWFVFVRTPQWPLEFDVNYALVRVFGSRRRQNHLQQQMKVKWVILLNSVKLCSNFECAALVNEGGKSDSSRPHSSSRATWSKWSASREFFHPQNKSSVIIWKHRKFPQIQNLMTVLGPEWGQVWPSGENVTWLSQRKQTDWAIEFFFTLTRIIITPAHIVL